MFDGMIRPKIDPALGIIARTLAKVGLSGNMVTSIGLLIGLLAAFSIMFHLYWLGLVLLIISRICDGLDGAVARINGSSDFGGYIDIVFDFIFYGIIPLAFVIADPERNAVAGAVLIFAFYANGASFLAFAIMAEKHGLTTEQRGKKSFFFTTGLAEATETIACFVIFCLFPVYFGPVAYIFAFICFYTTIIRIWQAKNLLP